MGHVHLLYYWWIKIITLPLRKEALCLHPKGNFNL